MATTPQKKATKVFFKLLVQVLKSAENSISGMAKGTQSVCKAFCQEKFKEGEKEISEETVTEVYEKCNATTKIPHLSNKA